MTPLKRDWPDGACHHLGMNFPPLQFRQQFCDLSPTNQRFTPYDRQVERPMAIDQREDSSDELPTLEVTNSSQRSRTTSMVFGNTASPLVCRKTL
jgi:hypothetical protein